MHRISLCLVLTCFVALSVPSFAQQTGGISGTIRDPTGAILPDAQVKATNLATGAIRTVESNGSGNYVLSPLPVGQYTIEVQKAGFKTMRQSGIVININSALTLNFSMPLGNVSQQVTVSAAPPQIDTENQELGNYRFHEQIKNLPVIVREIDTLVGQTPGVPYGTGAKSAADTDTIGGTFSPHSHAAQQVLADGAQVNSFQTTGYPAIDGIGRRADLTMPNLAVVQEFKLVTSGASAAYGDPVAIIVATKSGSNQFHGSAYEFYQSGGLAAKTWRITKPQSFVRHQFGGSFSGPIIRNKLLFDGAAEEFSHVVDFTAQARYPTDAERGGDLSDLLSLPKPVQLYDPTTHEPIPGNIIDPTMISPVTAQLLKLIPSAPTPIGSITNFNAIYSKPEHDISQKYDARIDWNINPKNFLFVRTTIGHIDQQFTSEGTVPGNYGFDNKAYYTQLETGTFTHVFGPRGLVKVSATRRSEPFKSIPTFGDTLFPVPIVGLIPPQHFQGPPAVTNGGGGASISDLTDRKFNNWSDDNDFQIAPSFDITIQNHTLIGGLFFLHGNKSKRFAYAPWGQYTTASDFNNPKSTTSATGDAFADYLLGYPSSTEVTIGPTGSSLTKTDWSLYLQDDWKVTPRLTVNLGIRYDNYGFFRPADNRFANADLIDGKIIIPDDSQALINPAFKPYESEFVTASSLGLNNSLTYPNNHSFVPRLGFAYRFRPQTVIRGGFGIYTNDVNVGYTGGGMNSPPFTYAAHLNRGLLLSNGVDVNTDYTFQNPTANGSTAAAASTLSAFSGWTTHLSPQTVEEYSLTLAKQIGSYVLTASYSGNVQHNMDRVIDVNACPPGPVTCLQRAAGTTGARKFPQFGITFGSATQEGTSNYNAAYFEVSRRMRGGFAIDVNFSHGRLFAYQYEASNPVVDPLWQYDYGPVEAQPYNIFHFNHVYQLPLGRGKRFGGNINPVLNLIVGDWMLSGVGTWESGQPLTVTAGSGQSPTGATTNRADRSCSGHVSKPTTAEWFNTSCYSVPSYIDPSLKSPARQFGTAGIGTVIGPRWFSYDANLQKGIPIREYGTLTLRVDSFNPFNHPVLDDPSVSASSNLFGQIRTANSNYQPRAFQFGARFEF